MSQQKERGNLMAVLFILSTIIYIPLAVLMGLADKYK